jgi:hypothetical protein
VVVQEALEALHEEVSPEAGAGEHREDVVDLEIVEEEHHEVEVAFQAAAELQEVVALAEGEARLHEPCALFGLRIVQDTGQKRPDEHWEASWRYRYPSTGTEGYSTRWKIRPSAKICAIYHSIDACEIHILAAMPGGCAKGFFCSQRSPWPCQESDLPLQNDVSPRSSKAQNNFKIVRRRLHITDPSTFVPLSTFLSLPLVLQPRFYCPSLLSVPPLINHDVSQIGRSAESGQTEQCHTHQ